jgi:hypothetical protein
LFLSQLPFSLVANPSTATHRSTAHRSSTADQEHRPLYSLSTASLSLSLSLSSRSATLDFCCVFSLSLNGRSLLGFVVIIFCCFCCLFLVLEDARRVFDKMSETNDMLFICFDE